MRGLSKPGKLSSAIGSFTLIVGLQTVSAEAQQANTCAHVDLATACGVGAIATDAGSAFGAEADATDGLPLVPGLTGVAGVALDGDAVDPPSAPPVAPGPVVIAPPLPPEPVVVPPPLVGANSAYGTRSDASGANAFNTALGATANASGDNGHNVAIGHAANAAGAGGNGVAIGASSQATHLNATALGADARTTRDGQQVFGTASNTYTLSGVASGDSTAAQGTVYGVVTTDADGNLASDGGQLAMAVDTNTTTLQSISSAVGATGTAIGVNTAAISTNADSIGVNAADVSANADNIAVLNTGFNSINSSISSLQSRDEELADGIAISMSLESPDIERDQSFALRLGYGNFDGESAVGLSAAGVVSRGGFGPTSSVKVDAGIGYGAGSQTLGGKAGVTIGW